MSWFILTDCIGKRKEDFLERKGEESGDIAPEIKKQIKKNWRKNTNRGKDSPSPVGGDGAYLCPWLVPTWQIL